MAYLPPELPLRWYGRYVVPKRSERWNSHVKSHSHERDHFDSCSLGYTLVAKSYNTTVWNKNVNEILQATVQISRHTIVQTVVLATVSSQTPPDAMR